MNNRTRIIARYLFVVLLGIFLSFAFALSSSNLIVGLFAPINTSVWESLKLLFYPMLVLTIWDFYSDCCIRQKPLAFAERFYLFIIFPYQVLIIDTRLVQKKILSSLNELLPTFLSLPVLE